MRVILFTAAFVVLAVSSHPVSAGELLGNTYTSSKYGLFEISSPEGKWIITDNEDKPPNVCGLKTKVAIGETVHKPVIKVTAVKIVEDVVDDDFMVEIVKEAIEEMGGEFTKKDRTRVSGKKTQVVYFKLDSPLGGKLDGRYYLLRGDQSYFMFFYVVHESVEASAEVLLQNLLSTLKF